MRGGLCFFARDIKRENIPLVMMMWRGRYAFDSEKNTKVMISALEYYKNRLNDISNDKEVKDLPKAVKILLQNEANTQNNDINYCVGILKEENPQLNLLHQHVSLLETALKIYKTDLQTVRETMASTYPGLFGTKQSPNIVEEIGVINKVLDEIKI